MKWLRNILDNTGIRGSLGYKIDAGGIPININTKLKKIDYLQLFLDETSELLTTTNEQQGTRHIPDTKEITKAAYTSHFNQ